VLPGKISSGIMTNATATIRASSRNSSNNSTSQNRIKIVGSSTGGRPGLISGKSASGETGGST